MILKTANCEILSKVTNTNCDVKKAHRQRGVTAYLLSESSLFVYDNRIVLKTCGKTTPLAALPELLDLGGKKGGSAGPRHVSTVLYSHPAYFRPELQEPLYRHFDHECRFLESYFPEGEAHHLGPQGRGVDLFVANYLPADALSDFVQAEVYVTGLDPGAMEKFGQAKSDAVGTFWQDQGCEHLDEFRFEPYGYSPRNATSVTSEQFFCSVTVLNRDGLCAEGSAPRRQRSESATESTDESTADSSGAGAPMAAALDLPPPPKTGAGGGGCAGEPRDAAAVAAAYAASKKELDDAPVMFVDTKKVTDKFLEWKQHLPRVQPCYAVKCNPNNGILHTLARLEDGPGFDCASEAEMRKVLDMGVPPDCLVYSNPCKQLSGIAFP